MRPGEIIFERQLNEKAVTFILIAGKVLDQLIIMTLGSSPTERKRCPKCGNSFTGEPIFCNNCGTILTVQQNNPKSAASDNMIIGFLWDTSDPSPRLHQIDSTGAIIANKDAAFWDDWAVTGNMKTVVVTGNNNVLYGTNNRGDGLDLSGASGDVMVEIPRFYTRSTYANGKFSYWISPIPAPGFTVAPMFNQRGTGTAAGTPAPYYYVGRYHASLAGNKLQSATGKAPAVSMTIGQARTYAEAKGAGWGITNIWTLSGLRQLFYTEMLTLDSQSAWAKSRGVVDYLSSDGPKKSGADSIDTQISANSATGSGTGADGQTPVSYRGIENLWGNVVQFQDGFNAIQGTTNVISPTGLGTRGSPTVFKDLLDANDVQSVGALALSDGWQKNLINTDVARPLFLPSAVGGSKTTYLSDYYWYPRSTNAGAPNILLSGGAWAVAGGAGVGGLFAAGGAPVSRAFFGARVEFRRSTPPVAPEAPAFSGIIEKPELTLTLDHPQLIAEAEAVVDTTPSVTPDLEITLDQATLVLSTWHKVQVPITNTGKAHAISVILSFSDDFQTRLIKPVTVEAGTTKVVEIGVLPKTLGNIPIEVTMNYKDEKDHKYTKTCEFWVEVQSQNYTSQSFKPGTGPGQPAPLPTSQTPSTAGNLTMRTIPPEMTEKYSESEFIGKGGFARVFKAKRKDGVYVAVKVPIYTDESTGKSFITEMQNWAKFVHPNIVKIYDYNIMPIPYFEEELCDGSLDKMKKPLDPAKAAWIMFNVCEGLKYAHARQVIHRDLKPQNILLKNGAPKISDWGLSKVITDSTSSMTSASTPKYAAPEQVTNKPKDERTDIWQVGVILYELVTGSLPFTGDNMLEIVVSISTRDPVPPGDINPETKTIEPVILRCMEKNLAKRYQSVTELQKDLAGFLKIDFKESMRMSIGSNNIRQVAVLNCQLLLTYLKSGDLHEAYKYATDLVNYSDGEVRDQVKELSEQIRMRIDNDMDEVPDEIISVADLVAHKIGFGFTTL
jgi:serine/threonine protein kinase